MHSILLAEDDPEIVNLLKLNFDAAVYELTMQQMETVLCKKHSEKFSPDHS